jgi:ribonuclease III
MFDVLDGNYKGRLLEITAAHFGAIRPEYFHFEYGPPHAKVFRCVCIFRHDTSVSEGRTKVEAEQIASHKILDQIQKCFIKKSDAEWILSNIDEQLSLSSEMIEKLGDLSTDARFGLWSLYGDAVLRYHIARYLFDQYPNFREGLLTRLVAEALRSETRALMARKFSIEKYVRTECTPKVLAETLSAVVGKLAITSEFIAKDLVMQYYRPFLDRTVADILDESHETKELFSTARVATRIHNFKNELLEYAQRNNFKLPAYSLISKEGADHDQLFTVQCIFRKHQSVGSGKTIKSAEQDASEKMLTLLHECEAASLRIIRKSSSYTQTSSKIKIFQSSDLDELKSYIGWHYFKSLDNLILAFTHSSQNSEDNYQRLEFLGDAILRKTMIAYIIKTYPNIHQKNNLSMTVDHLVSADTQVKIAVRLKLDKHLFALSPPSSAMLSDVVEALIATIYLDSEDQLNDYQPSTSLADPVILAWFLPEIENTLGKSTKIYSSLFNENKPPILSNKGPVASISSGNEDFPKLISSQTLSLPAEIKLPNLSYSAVVMSSMNFAPKQNNMKVYSSLFKEYKKPILSDERLVASTHSGNENFPRLPSSSLLPPENNQSNVSYSAVVKSSMK